MSLASLTRASGLAGILGGLLIALFFILHPGGQEPGTVLTTHYSLEHTLAVAAYILILFFLPAAYSLQAESCGFLGFLDLLGLSSEVP